MITAHTDVVGSLLRPVALRKARDDWMAGLLSHAQFKSIEDRAVDEAVSLSFVASQKQAALCRWNAWRLALSAALPLRSLETTFPSRTKDASSRGCARLRDGYGDSRAALTRSEAARPLRGIALGQELRGGSTDFSTQAFPAAMIDRGRRHCHVDE